MKYARLLFILLPTSLLLSQKVDVQEYMLKNGMKILLVEDHTVPSICYYVYFKVGNRHEKLGTTGISHLFEHMMFNGSKKYKPGDFDRILEAGGGYSNGSTWNDFTNYWEEFNSDLLEKVLDLEADRMRSLKIDSANLEQERGIVKEERRVSVDNNVRSKMYEELYAAAFTAHPYQNPVVGWMGDLDNINLNDCKEFFRIYYAPNNAVVILTGDFRSDDAVRNIRSSFERIPAQRPPRQPNNPEPEQRGERRIQFHKAAQLPAVMIGYKGVAVSDSDYYATEVLSLILSRGQSSRLYKQLVYEKQMCATVSAWTDDYVDPGLFGFYAQMKQGFATEQAEKEIYEIIETVKKDGVTEQELQKAKNTAQADFVRRFKTNQGTGFILGYYEVIHGDYKKAFTVTEAYARVTKEDIRRVANRLFDPMRRTVVTLVPEKTETTSHQLEDQP
ncbi:MAG TPA: pitrilysin family protein [Bacteroidota bacterium]|nr:pitrilysin family protein [Bacteroidota bacterium]